MVLGAAPLGERAAQGFDVAGRRLRLFSAGRFETLPAACRAFAGGRIAHCRIGKGEAWLVGDADLLFAPLWQPPLPGAAHLRRADTMEWLDARLRGRSEEHMSELQSLMRISYSVFCLKKQTKHSDNHNRVY